MQEMPDVRGDGTHKSYPRMELGRPMTTDQLAERISQGTTFGKGEVRGILIALAKELAQGMQEGSAVQIEGIGSFSLSLGLSKHASPEEGEDAGRRNARSITVRGINFRADKELVRASADGLKLERAGSAKVRPKDSRSPQERLALAQRYLDEHPFMKVADYCLLTGMASSSARHELRTWDADPGSGIMATGRASHRVYVKRTGE